jgi:two-component SAPR family response regulator
VTKISTWPLLADFVAKEVRNFREKRRRLDVLFTDIGLMDDPQAGLELAKQAVEWRPELKVLYATSQTLTMA